MIVLEVESEAEMVPGAGIEPARHSVPRDFKSLASTSSATQAHGFFDIPNKTASLTEL